jgi:hypothetical protein
MHTWKNGPVIQEILFDANTLISRTYFLTRKNFFGAQSYLSLKYLFRSQYTIFSPFNFPYFKSYLELFDHCCERPSVLRVKKTWELLVKSLHSGPYSANLSHAPQK